jgi:hypothetical protein
MLKTTRTKKNIYITVIAAFIGIGVFVGIRCVSKVQYARMFVTFGPTNVPCTEVNIQGKSYSVLVNLGSIVPLTLNKDVLSSIKKKPFGTMQFLNLNGNKIEYPTFVIPEIKIGDLTFTDVIVAERNEEWITGERAGEIGMPLLKKNNLMLDLPHSTIIACNSEDKLKKMGYILKDMTQVPFEMVERAGGVIVHVSTDVGIVKLALCTGSTLSLIRSTLVKENETQRDEQGTKFVSSTFVIGGKNWGYKELYLQDFPSNMQEVNGFIGMDFLDEHIVYIDFKNKTVYFRDRY